jgi:hypothetical protein
MVAKLRSWSSNTSFANNVLFIGIPTILLLTLIVLGFMAEGSQQFSMLANSFVHGHTYFLSSIGGVGQDPVLYRGHVYWDDGFFPAVVLMPFVAFFNLFHIFFYQGYLKWMFVVLTAYFIFKLAQHFKYTVKDSLVLVFGFMLATVYMGVNTVSSGWLFAQIITTFLLFWALYEYYHQRKWWLIGLLCGFIFLTRIPAASIGIFFLLTILVAKYSWKKKFINLVWLGSFVVIGIILIASYNYQRFGNPFNNGNYYQEISTASAEARSMGLLSIDHIPTNLYTFLLRGPSTVLKSSSSWSLKPPYISNNELGMSIFITSPLFIYLLTRKWSSYSRETRFLLLSSLISLIILLLYYGDGADQFGYRYSLDFLPELYVVFMIMYRKFNRQLSTGMNSLILASGLFNFYLVLSYIRW